jgi:hypothetical protein
MSLTIIITSSFIPSHPSIHHIKEVIESLFYTKCDIDTPIILAHDYCSDNNYLLYLKNLEKYISNKDNIKIVVRKSHGHLTGNVRNAISYVTTKYVLVIQHDFPFIRKFNVNKIINDMEKNPELKHIRFNKRKTTKVKTDAWNNLFGKKIKCKNYNYIRTPSWSDNNHICPTEYYKDIVLKKCSDGKPMEHFLIRKSKNKKIHKKYGTYIFGKLNEDPYILHTDGRKSN